MKDFVRENWKIAAICAGGALFLSLLTGLIARNPFGIALFRAFLLALLFGGLGVAARLVIRTYLPDLAAGEAAGGGAGQARPEETRGANVDITVGEEEAPAPPRPRPTARPAPPPADADAEPAEAAEEDTVSDLDDATSRAEAQALGELAEELSQELPEGAEGGEAAGEDGGEGQEGERPEPEEPVTAASSAGPSTPSGETDLDSLPDISNLEIAAPEAEPRKGRAARGEPARPDDALRGAVSGQDPATLARAIRTVLKKDEKG